MIQNNVFSRDNKIEQGSAFIAAMLLAILLSNVFGLAHLMAQENKKPLTVKPGAPGEASQVITVEQSLAMGQSHYTVHDTSFMQMMIIHHAQAIDMSDLIEARTSHERLRLMGKRITMSQEAEIDMMRTWLARRKQALEPAGGHRHHMPQAPDGTPSDIPRMTGMLSPLEMVKLAASDGVEFRRLYLKGMMKHHGGALEMVKMLLSNPGAGEDPEMSEFLSSIVADQSAEILRMNVMLSEL